MHKQLQAFITVLSLINKPKETMKPIHKTITLLAIAFAGLATAYAQDPLPSWNDAPAKQAIVALVEKVTKGRLAGLRSA